MIPIFPEFNPVEIQDKDIIESYFKKNPPGISEMTFTNLFIWRDVYHYKVSHFNDGFLILGESRGELFFLEPLVKKDYSAAISGCFNYLKNRTKSPSIQRVSEDFINKAKLDNNLYDIKEDRDNFDYVYSAQELIELSKAKFHDKKNLINQFSKSYQYRYRPLGHEVIDSCLKFSGQWCEIRDCPSIEGLQHEYEAVRELLLNFDYLSVFGGAIEIDGVIAAFTIGEPLAKDTFVIHIEKADNNIIGLYQAINQEFLKNAASSFKFVNREQDLGVEGLRKAKMSYNPVSLIKKYTISKH